MDKIFISDLLSIQDRVSRLFEDVLVDTDPVGQTTCGTWSPAVDIYETETEFIVKAEVPAVKRSDIDIRILNNRLIIKGERKPNRVVTEGYHRIERAYGRFQRSFLLPASVDRNEINASLGDGVLSVVLSKKRGGIPKHLEITEL